MRLAVLIASVLLLGCGARSFDAPLHDPGLLRGGFEPLAIHPPLPADTAASRESEEGATPPTGEARRDLRAAMVDRARRLLAQGGDRGDYGQGDLASILGDLVPTLEWRAEDGLVSLVKIARATGAYHATGRPAPGDIVLFHNQRDANGNGELDDWLSGCGIAIGVDGRIVETVARTGNAPRIALAWPDGPATAVHDGRKVNSFLRIPHRSDPKGTEYLAGQLFAGYLDIEALAAGAGAG